MAGDPTTFYGDVYVAGTLAAANQLLPANTVGNTQVQGLAGISASKLQHQHQITKAISRHGFDAGPMREALHVTHGATGTIVAFKAGAVTPAGAATTTTVNLYVNGSSVLSAGIELDNGDAAFALVAGTISAADLVVGDVLEVVVTGSGTNEPQGVFCYVAIREDAQ